MISLRGRAFSLALTRLASATLILKVACTRTMPDVTEPPPPRPVFQENFEAARNVADLFPATGSRWHGFQIQPASNDIEVTTARSRTGAHTLLCAAAAGPGASQ